MLPVGLEKFEKFAGVRNVNQPQLRLVVNGLAKRRFRQFHRAMQIRPPLEGRFAHLLLADIVMPCLFCGQLLAVTFQLSDKPVGTLGKTWGYLLAKVVGGLHRSSGCRYKTALAIGSHKEPIGKPVDARTKIHHMAWMP
jgi:hypothetical protein